MCAIKWALKNNLRQSISTYFLSWPSNNKFRATCLQMLSVWGCHFNSSSIVIPRTLCSRTCSIMFVPSVRLSIRGLSWCFFWKLIPCSLSSRGELPCDFGHTILIHHLNPLEDYAGLIPHLSYVSESSYRLQKDHIQLWY